MDPCKRRLPELRRLLACRHEKSASVRDLRLAGGGDAALLAEGRDSLLRPWTVPPRRMPSSAPPVAPSTPTRRRSGCTGDDARSRTAGPSQRWTVSRCVRVGEQERAVPPIRRPQGLGACGGDSAGQAWLRCWKIDLTRCSFSWIRTAVSCWASAIWPASRACMIWPCSCRILAGCWYSRSSAERTMRK
jgi:hypothetical protein